MIRLEFLMRRKPELTREEFQRYWREQHGPLVAGLAGPLGVQRYSQLHTLEDGSSDPLRAARGGMQEPFDGVAELWFNSLDDLTGPDAVEAGSQLLEDEKHFIDLPNSPLWFAHEYPQVNPTPEDLVAREASSIVKLFFPLNELASQKPEEAQLYWRTCHGPLIRRLAPAMGLLRYQQAHRFETGIAHALRRVRGTQAPAYLGHAEAWLDRGRLPSGPETERAAQLAIEDEARFIDFERSSIWLGKEHVFVDRF